MKHWLRLLLPLLVLTIFTALTGAREGATAPPTAPAAAVEAPPFDVAACDAATLAAVGRLPVQDGGRIKPLSTFAAYTLLRLHGRRTLHTAGGERLPATAWLLELLLDPHAAAARPLFTVADRDAVAALGLEVGHKQRRDRYSFDELRPAVPRLFQLAHEYGALPDAERTHLQDQVSALAANVDSFLRLAGALDFAQVPLTLPRDARCRALFGGAEQVRFAELVARGPQLGALYRQLSDSTDTLDVDARRQLEGTLALATDLGRSSAGLALLPPAGAGERNGPWNSPGDLFARALAGAAVDPRELAALEALVAFSAAREQSGELRAAADRLFRAAAALAAERGELSRLDLEVAYFRWRLLTFGLLAFLGGFLALSLVWLMPRRRWPRRLALGAAGLGLAALVLAIVLRCLIRGRPPVSTLYETVLFVTAVGVFLGLLLEWLDRRAVALSLATLLGAVGLFLANGYELLDKRDTMPALVAVLDTNFWLATHVTAITIGYSAGLFAALLGSYALLVHVFRGPAAAQGSHRRLAPLTYGTLCCALLFSLSGTILGGLWANESWGRFWGWDPKENGALLICLTQIATLHARQCGLVREHGLFVLAAAGGLVVAFSWWGVNLLGVGLHSYGFTSGIHGALRTYYLLQGSVVGLGLLSAWRQRIRARAALRAARVEGALAPAPDPRAAGERRAAA
jgi:ABC-type transport system involved in cytochrome c biogenesis permease subunit